MKKVCLLVILFIFVFSFNFSNVLAKENLVPTLIANNEDSIVNPEDINYDDSKGCNSILGSTVKKENSISDPAYYLQFIFNLMKYIAIVLLFVLTIVDVAKAVVSGKDDETKKAGMKAVKRLVICIIIFFLPILIEFLFELVGLYNSATCGIK